MNPYKARLRPTAAAVRLALCGMGAAGALAAPTSQAVETTQVHSFAIPAGPLGEVLTRIAGEAGILLSFDPGLVAGKTAQAVQGTLTAEQAVQRALRGSGLEMVPSGGNAFTLRAAPAGELMSLPTLQVVGENQGSRIGLPEESHGFKADLQESATKTLLSLRETPQAISVVTRESIDARQANDINTALELTAGVTAGLSSGGGPFAGPSPRVADQFSLRGHRLNGDRDVRIDGFASGAQRNNFDLAAFERVEVIKGPSSVLYGQGSLGGFINLVRKKPQAEFMASAIGQAGSYNTWRVEGDITGPFDEEDKILGRVTAAYDHSGSFIDDVESRLTVVAPSMETKLGESTRALFQILYQENNFTPSLGIPLRRDGDEMKIPDISRSFYFGVAPSEESVTHESMVSARIDHDLSDQWLATLLLQRGANDRKGIMDSYGYGFYGAGDAYVYASIIEHETYTWSGELRLDGNFAAYGRQHQVILGLESNKRTQESRSGYLGLGIANIYEDNFEELGTVDGGDLPITFDVVTTQKNTAAYSQVIFNISDRTKLLAGLRYDETHLTDVETKRDDATTYRIGGTYDFTNKTTGYISYAESFNPVIASSQNGLLDPETGRGYELGLKSEWFDNNLSANVAVFQQELDNRPIDDPNDTDGVFPQYQISGGLQRTQGMEIEVSGSPMEGLTIGAASTWLEAEYIDRDDENYGLIPPETTDRQSSLYVSYQLQSGDFAGLGLGATLVSVGKRWAIDGGENVFVDGYERVDLHAYYSAIQDLQVTFQIRNVLDETYIERSNGAFGYGHYFGSPRAYLLRAKYIF